MDEQRFKVKQTNQCSLMQTKQRPSYGFGFSQLHCGSWKPGVQPACTFTRAGSSSGCSLLQIFLEDVQAQEEAIFVILMLYYSLKDSHSGKEEVREVRVARMSKSGSFYANNPSEIAGIQKKCLDRAGRALQRSELNSARCYKWWGICQSRRDKGKEQAGSSQRADEPHRA